MIASEKYFLPIFLPKHLCTSVPHLEKNFLDMPSRMFFSGTGVSSIRLGNADYGLADFLRLLVFFVRRLAASFQLGLLYRKSRLFH